MSPPLPPGKMQALISLHHPQDLERTAKNTDGSKDSLRLSELRSGMCVLASLACPLQGPWDLAFTTGPFEATLEPSSWVPQAFLGL